MKPLLHIVLLALCMLALATSSGRAELENENLLARMPEGYKVGFQKKSGGMLITEMVPANETVGSWTKW